MRTHLFFPSRILSILFLFPIVSIITVMPIFANGTSTESADTSLEGAVPFSFPARPVVVGSAADCSSLNTPITEAQRIVVTADGHLASNGKRVRMYGTNISSIPSKDDAAYWANVLASQGFNIVRFHHLDASWTKCFLMRDANGKEKLNEKKLDDFDYFFNELKKVGIYSDINMLTGRDIRSADGYPKELDALDWKERHALGFWNDAALEKQKWYAATILTHKNKYTGLTYAEDPAAAIVEINNENGLLASYENGTLDKYPQSATKDLEAKWNAWLAEKGESLSSLKQKYNFSSARGAEVIAKNGLQQGTKKSSWNIEHQGGSDATLTQKGSTLTVKVKKNGSQGWHVQLDNGTWPIQGNKIYTLTFRARASKPWKSSVYVMMNHDPWKNLNFVRELELTTKWQSFRFVICNFTAEDKARLSFSNMGMAAGVTFDFADVELVEGGECDFVKEGGVKRSAALLSLADSSGVPEAYRTLYLNFLYDVERTYWKTMREYIRNTLGVKALQMGTIASTSTIGIMQEFDIIDSHAYWYHPSFPVTSWDMSHYYVENKPLVNAVDGGTLADLAKHRMYNKPFSVTEYDHPFPSEYSSEMIPMFASFASFQDWDMIFNFVYDISQRYDGTPASSTDKSSSRSNSVPKISGYFDQANNPAKTPANTVGARIFRNFLVKPGERAVYAVLTRESERAKLIDSRSWNISPSESFGLYGELSLAHRIGFVWGETDAEAQSSLAQLGSSAVSVAECSAERESLLASRTSGAATVSDTGEIVWNAKDTYFAVHADRAFVTVAAPLAATDVTLPATKHSRAAAYVTFVPLNDFAVVAGAEYANDKYIVFSSSWSGNAAENARAYGEKISVEKKDFEIFRTPIKLTTDASLGKGPAIALASEGTLIVQSSWPVVRSQSGESLQKQVDRSARNQCVYRLYELKQDGTRGESVAPLSAGTASNATVSGATATLTASTLTAGSASAAQFELHRNSGTLWYELEIIRAQN